MVWNLEYNLHLLAQMRFGIALFVTQNLPCLAVFICRSLYMFIMFIDRAWSRCRMVEVRWIWPRSTTNSTWCGCLPTDCRTSFAAAGAADRCKWVVVVCPVLYLDYWGIVLFHPSGSILCLQYYLCCVCGSSIVRVNPPNCTCTESSYVVSNFAYPMYQEYHRALRFKCFVFHLWFQS